MKKRKQLLLLTVITVTMVLILAACGDNSNETLNNNDTKEVDNINEEGMPIVNDPITIDMFAGMSSHQQSVDWDDLLVWQQYEEETGIEINWNQVPDNSLEEKRNLALASDDLPDVFFRTELGNVDLFKYGQQGSIVALNDLIDDYAPNFKKILEENPTIRKAITFPDGNIYSLPTIVSEDFLSLRVQSALWLNQEWLDTLEMDVPESTEEFYDYLTAVKEQNPSGGEVDEIPYGAGNIQELATVLSGSFGIMNKGGANAHLDLDPEEDKVRFFANTDRYKEMLEYINKLYSEELIAQNIFSIEQDQFLADAANGVYGSSIHYNPVEVWDEEVGKDYVSSIALEGPHGDQSFVKVNSEVFSPGQFAITGENENPEATIRWFDHFYSKEGSKLYYMGIEGETFQETSDGGYEYVDKITNSPDGLTTEQEGAKYVPWFGMPMGNIIEEFFIATASTDGAVEAADKLAPFVPEEIWPPFTYTDEESKTMISVGSDIDKYVTEMRDKFIAGDVPFSEWEEYVKTIDDMGLEEYVEVNQAAYERYQDN